MGRTVTTGYALVYWRAPLRIAQTLKTTEPTPQITIDRRPLPIIILDRMRRGILLAVFFAVFSADLLVFAKMSACFFNFIVSSARLMSALSEMVSIFT